MADDCIPASPEIKKFKRKSAKFHSKRLKYIQNKSNSNATESSVNENSKNCIQNNANTTESSMNDTPVITEPETGMTYNDKNEQSAKLDVSMLYFSDSADECMDFFGGQREIYQQARAMEMCKMPSEIKSLNISENLYYTGMIPLSQLIEIDNPIKEEAIIPESEFDFTNTQIARLCDVADAAAALAQDEIDLLDWESPRKLNTGFPNKIETFVEGNIKKEREGSPKNVSEPQSSFLVKEIESPPKKCTSTSISQTYSQLKAEKQKARKYKYEDSSEDDSETSCISDISIQNDDIFNCTVSEDLDLNKSSRVCENLLNLSSFFTQSLTQNIEDDIEVIYRHIMHLKKKKPEERHLNWFRKRKNFRFDPNDQKEDFKGFEQSSSDDSLSEEDTFVIIENTPDRKNLKRKNENTMKGSPKKKPKTSNEITVRRRSLRNQRKVPEDLDNKIEENSGFINEYSDQTSAGQNKKRRRTSMLIPENSPGQLQKKRCSISFHEKEHLLDRVTLYENSTNVVEGKLDTIMVNKNKKTAENNIPGCNISKSSTINESREISKDLTKDKSRNIRCERKLENVDIKNEIILKTLNLKKENIFFENENRKVSRIIENNIKIPENFLEKSDKTLKKTESKLGVFNFAKELLPKNKFSTNLLNISVDGFNVDRSENSHFDREMSNISNRFHENNKIDCKFRESQTQIGKSNGWASQSTEYFGTEEKDLVDDMKNTSDFSVNDSFKTASGKNITVTKKGLLKAQMIVKAVDEEMKILTEQMSQPNNFEELSVDVVDIRSSKSVSEKDVAEFKENIPSKQIRSNSALKKENILKESTSQHLVKFAVKSNNKNGEPPSNAMGPPFSTYLIEKRKPERICSDIENKLKIISQQIPRSSNLERNIRNDFRDFRENIENSADSGDDLHKKCLLKKSVGVMSSFRSASGKNITISKRLLIRAETIAAEVDAEIDALSQRSKPNVEKETTPISYVPQKDSKSKESVSKLVKKNNIKDSPVIMSGFQSASGKNITISKSAMIRAATIAAEVEEETETMSQKHRDLKKEKISCISQEISKGKFSNCAEPEAITSGFQSASGKSITISKAAMIRAETIADEVDTEIETLSQTTNGCKNESIPQISQEVDQLDIIKLNQSKMEELSEFGRVIGITSGFQSASGKQITISKNAMARAETIVAEVDAEVETSNQKSQHNLPEVDVIDKYRKPAGIQSGFQSASGKIIKISTASMARAEILTAEVDAELEALSQKDNHNLNKLNIFENITATNAYEPKEKGPIGIQTGFQSASGERIAVSKQAITRVQTIVQEVDSELEQANFQEQLLPSTQLNDFTEQQSTQDRLDAKHNLNVTKTCISPRGAFFDSNPRGNVKPKSTSQDTPLSRPNSNSTKGRLSLSRKKFLPPFIKAETERKFVTPIKSETKLSMAEGTPEFKAFFDSISTSTPLQDIECEPKTGFNLTQEISASTAAIMEDELEAFSLADDFKQICWESFDAGIQPEESTISEAKVAKNIVQGRNVARLKQQRLIEEKIKTRVEIRAGILYRRKSETKIRVTYLELVGKDNPQQEISVQDICRYGVTQDVAEITFRNACEFNFDMRIFASSEACGNVDGIRFVDGANLILSDNNLAGITEVSAAFLAMPAVDPRLVPENWIQNHFVQILFKLSIMEKWFPSILARQMCTLENLFLHLKYRYDREIDRAERSALRKIYECDDIPGKRIVLMVVDIVGGDCESEMIVSDGWYTIRTVVDLMMRKYLKSGRVRIGTKLMVQNAELLNCEHGCSPLESTSVLMKIHTNSTRRAKWTTKLGFYKIPRPFLLALDQVSENGGIVTRLRLCAIRRYPLLYFNSDKKQNGSSGFHSEKVENRFHKESETVKYKEIETLLSQIQNEMEAEVTGHLFNSQQDFCDTVAAENDTIMKQQQEVISRKSEEVNRRIQGLLRKQVETKSVEMLKIRVVDALSPGTSAILSIWRPDEDVQSMLKEGMIFEVTQLTSSCKRGDELQFSSSSQSKFKMLKSLQLTVLPALMRKELSLEQICKADGAFRPQFDELDTCGYVAQIDETLEKNFQSVFLVDANANILNIKFWAGLRKFAYDDVVQEGKFLAVSNVQWRSNSSMTVIKCVFSTDVTIFTENPKRKELCTILDRLREEFGKEDKQEILRISREKIKNQRNQRSKPLTTINYGNQLYRSTSYSSLQSTRPSTSPAESQTLRPSAQNRIDRLSMYSNPPPLSPIVPNKLNRTLRQAFRVPTLIEKNSSSNFDDNSSA